MTKSEKAFDVCPHCGQKLTPWQQVLLSVDRALMCKNCWYRIQLTRDGKIEAPDDDKESSGSEKKE